MKRITFIPKKGKQAGKTIVGQIEHYGTLLLDNDTNEIYFQYMADEAYKLNQSFDHFMQCLDITNFTIHKINIFLQSNQVYKDKEIQDNTFIEEFLETYSIFVNCLHTINTIDFESSKTYFWQERLMDFNMLLDQYEDILVKHEQTVYAEIYINNQIEECIQHIHTYDDYLKIKRHEIIEVAKAMFEENTRKGTNIATFINKKIILQCYGEKGYAEYLEKKEARLKELGIYDLISKDNLSA